MIKDVLIVQKQELDNKIQDFYIEREQEQKLSKLDIPLIKVIIGPRRAGKSFFSIKFLERKGSFGYVNFDDERLTVVRDYDEIITGINSLYNNPKYLLLDEIQNLPKWELFVNRLQRQGFNLIVTGSNSNLLSSEFATHLTGRHLPLYIWPFSFKEYLKMEKKELTSFEIKDKLDKYLVCGGYPEPLIKKIDVREYLSVLLNSIIYKDIVKRYKIRFAQGIEDLSVYLLSNIANEFSYRSLSSILNIKSFHTVHKYLGYLEESFIFFSLSRFSYKVKEQIASNKKIYCIDNGFIHAKAFKISPDTGKLYENLVANKLREEAENNKKIFYWKNTLGEEVDFVIKENLKISRLIQVCYDIENIETKKREVRALIKAGKEFDCKDLLVITGDYEAEEDIEWGGSKSKIKFIPLWKWLIA